MTTIGEQDSFDYQILCFTLNTDLKNLANLLV